MDGPTLNPVDGPVVTSAKTLRALAAIRREKLLGQLYGQVAIARSNWDEVLRVDQGAALAPAGRLRSVPSWLTILEDRPNQVLPPRLAEASESEAATLRLALALPAPLVLLEGPLKERAKLSSIKCEGALSILVHAYRGGLLTAVPPMVKALEKLGHGDVLPPPQMLEALWRALEQFD